MLDSVRTSLRKLRDRYSARGRWVSGEYMPKYHEQREHVILSIARFCHINRPREGYWMEFGSHEANTMRLAWRHTRHLFKFQYVAFDSFAGLPEIPEIDKQEIWAKGRLETTETDFRRMCAEAGMPAERLTTIKGFYDDSLNDATAAKLAGKKAVAIYIDCDLYSSTVPILKFIKGFLQPGTIIVFDDWNCFLSNPAKGERRAWGEFTAANPELQFVEWIETPELKAFIYVGN